MRRLVTSWVLMAIVMALVAGFSPVLGGNGLAIIDDGPEPFPPAKAVGVTVTNTSSETRKGVVTIQAMVDGKQATSSATVVLKGGATTTVVVSFSSAVQSVTGVGIIEDPDPIPQ